MNLHARATLYPQFFLAIMKQVELLLMRLGPRSSWASLVQLEKRWNSGRRPREPVSLTRANSPIHCQEKRRPLTLLVESKSAYTEDGDRPDGLHLTLH